MRRNRAPRQSDRRWSRRGSAALLGAVTAGAIALVPASGAGAATGRGPGTASTGSGGPLAFFTANAPYRRGVVPTVGWTRAHPGAGAGSATGQNTSSPLLTFAGGTDGVGVTTGHERVYLVFWGTQWGKETTVSGGYEGFSGDHSGLAPRLQAFFKGLGTNNENWSGVMTQYCEGVTVGATSCPSDTYHVAYPTGGALAGVWADTSGAAPAMASGAQIGAVSVSAAAHFGNTTAASNRDAQYFVVSPSGTNPDDFKAGGFCAWHDYTSDPWINVASPYGALAFTNFPFLPDLTGGCGANFVNPGPAGALDGVTIVGGHEYAETITDQFPRGGWSDSSGAENGDKCAWITPGYPGGAQDIKLATGSFPVQSTWANDSHGGTCEVSHPVVHNGDIITVSNPGDEATPTGNGVSLQIHASDTASSQKLTYTEMGLPSGLSISASSGVVSGIASGWGTYAVSIVVKDPTGSSATTGFNWTVGSPPATWQTTNTPNPSTSYNQLSGVSCPSKTSCTAVGIAEVSGSGYVPAVEVWNGQAWTITSYLAHIPGQLNSVSCPSTSFCAVVGVRSGASTGLLAAQWVNGQWELEAVPVPTGATGVGLQSVWCASPTQCLAVGRYSIVSGGLATAFALATRWDGHTWSLVSIPSPSHAISVLLNSISCSSASNCEAVGSETSGLGTILPLAEQWNGIAWTSQQIPTVAGAIGLDIASVACPAANACTAVGSSLWPLGAKPAMWRWSGTAWYVVLASPGPSGSSDSRLLSIACYSTSGCTAIGSWTTSSYVNLTWATTWNGSRWMIERTPDPSGAANSQLYSISCTSSTTCAAVGLWFASGGYAHNFVDQTL